MKKRLLSVILTAMMVLTMLPMTSLAAVSFKRAGAGALMFSDPQFPDIPNNNPDNPVIPDEPDEPDDGRRGSEDDPSDPTMSTIPTQPVVVESTTPDPEPVVEERPNPDTGARA